MLIEFCISSKAGMIGEQDLGIREIWNADGASACRQTGIGRIFAGLHAGIMISDS